VLPDQSSVDETDSLVSQPSLEQVAGELGFPCVLKPFDGYAWEDVHNDQINTPIIPAAPKKVDATLCDSGIGSNHVTARITIPPTVTNAIRNIFNDLSIITYILRLIKVKYLTTAYLYVIILV
jgi:hypothetical protein